MFSSSRLGEGEGEVEDGHVICLMWSNEIFNFWFKAQINLVTWGPSPSERRMGRSLLLRPVAGWITIQKLAWQAMTSCYHATTWRGPRGRFSVVSLLTDLSRNDWDIRAKRLFLCPSDNVSEVERRELRLWSCYPRIRYQFRIAVYGTHVVDSKPWSQSICCSQQGHGRSKHSCVHRTNVFPFSN